MNTKILYIVTSTKNDIYFEQAWASAWSVRHYSPSAKIVLLADSDTLNAVKNSSRKNGLALFDEIIAVDFEPHVSNKVRSRYLKTSMRNIVSGDFLFIDSDTVVTGSLDYVDAFDFDLGMVPDLHCPVSRHPFESGIKNTAKKLFDLDVSDDMLYFNSGVVFAQDSSKVHNFFHCWHKNWERSCNKGMVLDQPALLKTDIEMGGFIKIMDGNLNCQILGSIAYLHTAKIVHFFNTTWSNAVLSPFFGKELYLQIKREGCISDEVERIILSCKSSFSSPSMPIQLDDMKFWFTSAYRAFKILCDSKCMALILNFLGKVFLKIHKLANNKRYNGGGYNCKTVFNRHAEAELLVSAFVEAA